MSATVELRFSPLAQRGSKTSSPAVVSKTASTALIVVELPGSQSVLNTGLLERALDGMRSGGATTIEVKMIGEGGVPHARINKESHVSFPASYAKMYTGTIRSGVREVAGVNIREMGVFSLILIAIFAGVAFFAIPHMFSTFGALSIVGLSLYGAYAFGNDHRGKGGS